MLSEADLVKTALEKADLLRPVSELFDNLHESVPCDCGDTFGEMAAEIRIVAGVHASNTPCSRCEKIHFDLARNAARVSRISDAYLEQQMKVALGAANIFKHRKKWTPETWCSAAEKEFSGTKSSFTELGLIFALTRQDAALAPLFWNALDDSDIRPDERKLIRPRAIRVALLMGGVDSGDIPPEIDAESEAYRQKIARFPFETAEEEGFLHFVSCSMAKGGRAATRRLLRAEEKIGSEDAKRVAGIAHTFRSTPRDNMFRWISENRLTDFERRHLLGISLAMRDDRLIKPLAQTIRESARNPWEEARPAIVAAIASTGAPMFDKLKLVYRVFESQH